MLVGGGIWKIRKNLIIPFPYLYRKKQILTETFLKGIKLVKDSSTATDLLNNECSNGDKYSNRILAPFITADKFDIFIIRDHKRPKHSDFRNFHKIRNSFSNRPQKKETHRVKSITLQHIL